MSILKTFGMGLLYTVLSPLIAIILVLYFLYTFISFIIMFFIDIFKFFKGKSILDDLAIEVNAKKILSVQEEYENKLRDSILNNSQPASYYKEEPTISNTISEESKTLNDIEIPQIEDESQGDKNDDLN